MNIKQKITGGLHAGQGYQALLDMARSADMTSQETYDVLEEIWLEMGFDAKEDGSTLRDELEYAMEKVWFQCPADDPSSGK